ncbi:hypothetical protein N9K64_06515, partial [Rhodobacteraceae bacterium]|nr:hypothetical protein [Paracoccaceae bacterium]
RVFESCRAFQIPKPVRCCARSVRLRGIVLGFKLPAPLWVAENLRKRNLLICTSFGFPKRALRYFYEGGMPSKKLIADPKCEDLLTVRRIFKVEPLVCQILLATLSKTRWRSNPNFVIQI